MNLQAVATNARLAAQRKAPEILTGGGITGVLSTSYLVGKGSFEAASLILEEDIRSGTSRLGRKERTRRNIKLVWRCYIPAGISGAATIVCIVGASKASARRTAAAVTAYSLSEQAFREYKEKVVETIGQKKEEAVRDEVAQDRTDRVNPGSKTIVLNDERALCLELLTGRYFRSDMDTLRKAEARVNKMLETEMYVDLDDFYDLVGLDHTSQSNRLGWDGTRQMSLNVTTCLGLGGEPCLSFDYGYLKPL